MTTIYRANDGKEFSNEIECKNYEQVLEQNAKAINEVICFDMSLNICPINNFDEVYLIDIPNRKALGAFRGVVADLGYEIDDIEEPGMWYYDDGTWVKDNWFFDMVKLLKQARDKATQEREARNI